MILFVGQSMFRSTKSTSSARTTCSPRVGPVIGVLTGAREPSRGRRLNAWSMASRVALPWIAEYYNTRRLHSTLGYRTPAEVRSQHAPSDRFPRSRHDTVLITTKRSRVVTFHGACPPGNHPDARITAGTLGNWFDLPALRRDSPTPLGPTCEGTRDGRRAVHSGCVRSPCGLLHRPVGRAGRCARRVRRHPDPRAARHRLARRAQRRRRSRCRCRSAAARASRARSEPHGSFTVAIG
jgi:hypothetical protein